MRSVSYISDNGTVIHFGTELTESTYFFDRLDDYAGGTAETNRAPRQNGQDTQHVSLDSRTIVLEGQMYNPGSRAVPVGKARDTYKDHLFRAFMPNSWGTLIYNTDDGGRQIRARAIARPTVMESESPMISNISVDLITDDALWESTELRVYQVGGIYKMLHFPWVPIKRPLGTHRTWGTVENDWVEEVFPVLEVFSMAKVVTITNETTGGFLKVNHPIEDNQKMVVDMEEMSAMIYVRENGIYKEDFDATHYISLDSAPWGLVPGKNIVRIENEDDTVTPLSFLRYRKKYGGV